MSDVKTSLFSKPWGVQSISCDSRPRAIAFRAGVTYRIDIWVLAASANLATPSMRNLRTRCWNRMDGENTISRSNKDILSPGNNTCSCSYNDASFGEEDYVVE